MYGRPILKFKRPEGLDGNGAVDVMTRHWIGNRRVDKLGRKEPDQFIDVTKRCIRYRIDAPLRSLEDSLFLELFFTKWYNCCGRSLKVLLDFRAQSIKFWWLQSHVKALQKNKGSLNRSHNPFEEVGAELLKLKALGNISARELAPETALYGIPV